LAGRVEVELYALDSTEGSPAPPSFY
jgi:hypothetical protein